MYVFRFYMKKAAVLLMSVQYTYVEQRTQMYVFRFDMKKPAVLLMSVQYTYVYMLLKYTHM
jgi:hypothetical protein